MTNVKLMSVPHGDILTLNGFAYAKRRDPHLAGMALFYASLTAFEAYVCSKHVTTRKV